MILYLKYNFDKTCRVILQEQLDRFGFKYTIVGTGAVNFEDNIPMEQYVLLQKQLNHYGIEIVDNQKAILVQKIKAAILSMLEEGNMPLIKISSFLSEKLNENYRTLSNVFTEVCHISIESFIIIQKIERVKQLLITENLSLTEISFRMNYSSVAHLSNQFKKITGFTPTVFQKVLHNKRIQTININ
ncbi:helix-turn-helix domain-containing protein [Flavobacterium sp. DGU11]|uniref:Helix-turn-helix domain-containing protein n=1 Tax=Flavobacterium arundinis TaxID=3139143 RepID=A0ABU9HZJ8_9FLAO